MGKVSVREIEMPVHMYSIKCPFYMTPEGITVHNTANDACAENEVKYMQDNFNQVSYHIAVDDREAVIGVPLNRNAWHAGDGSGTGNRKTIGVEICYSLSGGERFIKAEQNAAALIAEMLKERGWGIDRVYKHQDWSKWKKCPHRTIDMGWDRFLDMVRDELKLLGVVEKADETETSKDEEFEPYIVKITAYRLNFRSAAGTHGKIIGQIKQNERYTIVDEENGWGLLKSYAKNRNGWINLDYAVKV